MNSRAILLLLSAVIACVAAAQTPSADEYFNRAARHYVKEDKLSALRTLDAGLREHPGDARMLKLAEELLKENQQQQQQQQKQEQQQQQEQQRQEQQQEQQAKEQEAQEGQAEERERQQRSGQMTKEEAERMLDALEHKEQDVQQRVRTKLRPGRRVPTDKDW